MASTLEHELRRYLTQLSVEEQRSVLQMIKTFLKNRSDHSGRIGLEQYNEDLKLSEAQIEAGQFITQEDLEKEMKNW